MKFKYIFLILVSFLFTSCSLQSNIPNLDIGKQNLNQKVTVRELDKGVTFIDIKRGETSQGDFYTLSSGIISKENISKLVKKIQILGYKTRIETPSENGSHNEFLGSMVRVGKYQTLKEATVEAVKLKTQNINLSIRYTAEDGKETTGPFEISLLKIDLNSYKGDFISNLGQHKIQGKELTSSISNKNKAIASVNAGFFAWNNDVGIDGDPAGISIIDGELVSEASNGRSALIIDNNTPKRVYIAHNVITKISLFIDGKKFNVNGINRAPGKILNCGNSLDSISRIPIHDFVCSNPNEIILFNHTFGNESVKGEGLEFIVDETNTVLSFNQNRGCKIPKKGYVIQATGTYVEILEKLIKKGVTISVDIKILSDKGTINLKKGLYAVNGGPTLLHKGISDLSFRYKEGWETQFEDKTISDEFIDKNDATIIGEQPLGNRSGYYYGWVVRRHPRTAIGITKDNKVYIAVVYGRQPKVSVGASITEMSILMKNLGAEEAFNLDGGGSSMMIVKGTKTGKSSDKNGERAIGDALLLIPNK